MTSSWCREDFACCYFILIPGVSTAKCHGKHHADANPPFDRDTVHIIIQSVAVSTRPYEDIRLNTITLGPRGLLLALHMRYHASLNHFRSPIDLVKLIWHGAIMTRDMFGEDIHHSPGICNPTYRFVTYFKLSYRFLGFVIIIDMLFSTKSSLV